LDFAQILPTFGNTAFTIITFVVALSIIVAIHEYGHYIVGRWSGIHAEVFSLGFGPVLASRVDKWGTKWQFAALPFGGYVRFLGDTNAASAGLESDEGLPEVDRRRTMAGAPLWARTLTVLAGPVFNFILAIAIFAGVALTDGKAKDPVSFDTLNALPEQFVSEFQKGDQILTVEGMTFRAEDFEITDLPFEPTLNYEVMRDGVVTAIKGPYLMPALASSITPRSAADDAGLRKGDVITAIDGTPVVGFRQIVDAVKAVDGKPLTLDVWRDGAMASFTLAPRRVDMPLEAGGFETRWLIGIGGSFFFKAETESVSVLSSFTTAWDQLTRVLSGSLSGLWHVMSGQISTCNLSGPVGIAQTSGSMAEQGTVNYIWFVGMLSAAVGLLNLFPVPILDGGHLVFYAYEAVFRRKPSESVYNVLMLLGLGLIGAMMIFALLNDILLCP
jgi:regulator of sigma E protease